MTKKTNLGVKKAIEAAGSYQKLGIFLTKRRSPNSGKIIKQNIYKWKNGLESIPSDCLLLMLHCFKSIEPIDFLTFDDE